MELLRVRKFLNKVFVFSKNILLLHSPRQKGVDGAVAQLVEQRTENPCVAGSIPAHTTERGTVQINMYCSPFSLLPTPNPLFFVWYASNTLTNHMKFMALFSL